MGETDAAKGAGAEPTERHVSGIAPSQSRAPRTSRPPPVRLGPYRVAEELGVGGMGVVYRGVHDDGTQVAIKTVRAATPELSARLRREIHALRRLEHPGVVRVLEHGFDDGVPWYAMELVTGSSLREALDTRWGSYLSTLPALDHDDAAAADESTVVAAARPPRRARTEAPVLRRVAAGAGKLPELLMLLAPTCDALAFLHGEGVVHRDLKPDNVLVRDSGRPVLADFGLAGRFAAGWGREVLEIDEGIAGSASYMAPEQIRGELVDARSDLYALGCILYECVTGRVPFRGQNTAEICSAHLEDAPRPPTLLAQGVSPGLEELILTLLEKRPRDRAGDAAAVAALLRAELAAHGVSAPSVRGPVARAFLYRPELAGRDDTVDALDHSLAKTVVRSSGIVLLSGESGVGKTRLAMEVARRADAAGLAVIGCECVPVGLEAGTAGRAAPLSAFRGLLGHVADAGATGSSAELVQALESHAASLVRYEPRLGELAFVRGTEPAPELAADAERRRALSALREILVAATRAKPMLLIVDDLQWADELSLGFLAALDPNYVPGLLVLGTYRADEVGAQLAHVIDAHPSAVRTVTRLDGASIERMVADMLGARDVPEAFVERLTQASEGNPFFVAEYLRTAVEEGLLVRGPLGSWQLGDDRAPTPELGLPNTLLALVERRLSHLDDGARSVLDVLAVVGREAEWGLLEELSPLDADRHHAAVHSLLQRQIVQEDEPGVLRFAHDKLREVAYSGVLPQRASALHAAVARALEVRHEGVALVAWYPALAHHFEQAGEAGPAISYLERAGAHALRSGAPGDAIAFLNRAEELELAHPSAAGGATVRARRRRLLGEAHYVQGDLPKATDHCLDALDELGLSAPRSGFGWGRLLLDGLVHRALPTRRLSPDRVEPFTEGALAAQRIAERYYFSNDALRITAASLLAIDLAERSGAPVSRPHFQLGIVAGVAGLTRVAERCFARGREVAAAADDLYGPVMGAYTEIAYRSGLAEWNRAERLGHEALEVAERLGDPQEHDLLSTVIANLEAFTGRFEESFVRFSKIRKSARQRENPVHEAWGLYAGGAALLALGRTEEALADLHRAAGLLSGRSDVASEIITYGLLAQGELRVGNESGARRAALTALPLITGRMPAVYSTLHGFFGTAETLLRLWRRAQLMGERDPTLERAARAALFRLRLFARVLPFGEPAALHARALHAEIRGQSDALVLARCAAASAARLKMPYYEARALAEVARLAPAGSADRASARAGARRLFERLGAAWDLQQLMTEAD